MLVSLVRQIWSNPLSPNLYLCCGGKRQLTLEMVNYRGLADPISPSNKTARDSRKYSLLRFSIWCVSVCV